MSPAARNLMQELPFRGQRDYGQEWNFGGANIYVYKAQTQMGL